ncbi:MAG: hypothetical protein HRT88_10730, partial [Lentisphaeraceae bacterium]|nr:hypothetical protein [Lentisphaeraceae bacterium]
MTISELRNSIEKDFKSGISVISSNYFSQTSLDAFFPNEKAVIEHAQLTSTAQAISLSGSMRLFSNNTYPTNMEIVLDSNGDPQFKLETSLPSDWSFGESFPLLSQSVFSDLNFTNASFTIISDPSVFGSSLSTGLNFEGTISGGLPSPLNTIWSGDIEIAGPILLKENIPELTLNLKTNEAFSFDGFTLSNVACQLCTLAVQNISYSGNQIILVTNPNSINDFIRFSSSIEINTQTIDISGSYSFVTDSLILDATNLQLSLDDGLSGLFSLIGYTPTITWPAANFVLNDIFLTNISFLVGFQPSAPTLQSFGFGIAVNTNWAFIPNKVELESIKLSVWLSDPLAESTRQYGGAISGTFKIGDATGLDLDVTASMPSSTDTSLWKFSGYTYANQQIPIGHLVSDIGSKFGAISVPSFIDGLSIENLKISFDTAKNFNFACKGTLSIAGQKITTAFNIAFTDSDNGASSLSFTGSIWINENYFNLNFDHTGASGDQSASTVFSATWSDDGSGLTIQEIIDFFGLSLDIPSELDLALSSITIKYDTEDELFILEVQTSNYGSLVFTSFYDQKTSRRECFMGLELGSTVQLPSISNALNQLPSASKSNVDSFHLLLCSAGISDNQLITKLNTAIGTSYPQIPPNGLKGAVVNVNLSFNSSDPLSQTFTNLDIPEAHILTSLPLTLSSIGFLIEKNGEDFKTSLHIKTSGVVTLKQLLGGGLPFNPELNAIDFVMQYQSSSGNNKSSSTSFSFSTSFTDDHKDFVFVGAMEKATVDNAPVSIFGGNIFSPSGATIDIGGDFPINIDIKNLFLAKVASGKSSNG